MNAEKAIAYCDCKAIHPRSGQIGNPRPTTSTFDHEAEGHVCNECGYYVVFMKPSEWEENYGRFMRSNQL